MSKTSNIIRYALAILIILLGAMSLLEFLMKGYDPNGEDIMLFSEPFRNLHNALMQSYLLIVIRSMLVICGALLLTRKYWLIGLLMFMPIAVNILAIHLLYDLPPAHFIFFSLGMLVSLLAISLFVLERKRLRFLIISN